MAHTPHLHASPSPGIGRALKLAVAGKGGVGKTTVAAALARAFAGRGMKVLAVDADPDANLASALPLDGGQTAPAPLAMHRDLLRRTARGPEALPAGIFLLAPVVDDVPLPTATWGGRHRLVVLGWTARGGQGCYCDENAVLQRVLRHLVAQSGEVIVVDGEPGLEHLGRGTLASVDVLLAVLEPGVRSVTTAQTIRALAADLGIPYCLPLLSGVREPADAQRIQDALGGWTLLGALPFDAAVAAADLAGQVATPGPGYSAEIDRIASAILALPPQGHGAIRFAPRPHTHVGPDGRPYVHTHAADDLGAHDHG